MKAKEYVKVLEEGDYDFDSVSKTIKGLLNEIASLSKARNVSTLSGVNGVVQEIRQKWVAIYNRSNGHLKKDGFDKFLIKHKLLNVDCTVNANLVESL